jgi:exonuclease 3'-5' domain-containing protein 1
MTQKTQPVLVNNSDSIQSCLADLYTTPSRAAFAIDLEGVDLCREGRLSTMQIYPDHSSFVWIVDVTTLKATAFDEKDDKGRNLRQLLEDKNIKKVSWI